MKKEFQVTIIANSATALKKELAKAGITVKAVELIDNDSKILTQLNNSISNDEFGDDKHILQFLRNADEKTLDEMAHGYEFEPFKGATIEIVMWQPMEDFTLRQLASHIGL